MSIMSLLLGTGGIIYGPTPTINGSAQNVASTTTTIAATLTTSLTNNIIIAIVSIENTTVNSGTSLTSVAGAGLTWTKYTSQYFASTAAAGYGVLQEIWYATATGTLTSQSITATSPVTFDDATIIVFGVNGCNLSSPFDTNPNALQKTTFASGSTTKTVSNISTYSTNPLVIASWYTDVSNVLNTLDTGFTQIQYATNNGAVKWMYNFVEYKGFSGGALNGSTVSGASGASTDVWGAIVFCMTG